MIRRDFKRTDRISGTLLRELTLLIQREVKDPRLSKFITLSEAKISRDLGHAKIYFTVLHDDPVQTAAILNTAASYLRTQLARVIKLRVMPQLHFIYDESVEYGQRLSRLIDEVNPQEDEDAGDA